MRARAQAATEFCPAAITGFRAADSTVPATMYRYDLNARSERTVGGTVIADTDRGWYSWKQAPTRLVATRYTLTSPTTKQTYWISESDGLTVSFPVAVEVRRVWVASAQTHDESLFHWDNSGIVSCDPPDFVPMRRGGTNLERAPNAGDPTPAPPPAAAIATATAAPFPPATCAQQFVGANVKHPAQPVFPDSIKAEFSQEAVAEVYVAIGPDGKLVDDWIYSSSGYPAIDASTLLAVRQSSYTAAVSYCRPVGGFYIFRADFQPD